AERLLGWPPGELVGQPVTAVVPPRLLVEHREGFKRFAATRQPKVMGRTMRVAALRRDGQEIDIELTLSAATSGEPVVATMREARERLETERQLTVTRYLRATTRAAATLSSRRELKGLLDAVVGIQVEDFEAALARVWLLEPESGDLVLQASAGLSAEVAGSRRERIEPSGYPFKIAEVVRTHQPFIKTGLEGDPPFEQDWVRRERTAAVAIFPLMVATELRGVLVHFTRLPLHEEVVEALSAFVAIVTTALNDVQLLAREQAAREEADNQRRRLQTTIDALPVGV